MNFEPKPYHPPHQEAIPFTGAVPSKREIFRELIVAELRQGRLNPVRRARIVRFASQIGLTAVEAGRMIHECTMEGLAHPDPIVRQFALSAAEPRATRRWLQPHVAIITGLLLILIWLLR